MEETLKVLLPIVITHVIILVVVIIVIKRLLIGDSMNAVNRLKQVEVEIRKKEEGIRREIDEHEKEFMRKKMEAEEEFQKRREESEKELSRTRDQVIGESRAEAERMLDQARKGEEKLRQQIAQDMEEKAVDYGGQVFKLVFSERINEELNKQFVGELLDALDEVDGGSITVDTSEVEFIASHPLDPAQKTRLEQLLLEKFGEPIRVDERIQDDLLAGLVMKLGSLEIDGSLLNRYREAVDEVKKTAKV
ncbi:MAG: F0F1 ATP synthase subunit delta [Lentisphaerae bacterium]|nr:F0F1 ATP synthase subunit delta [Lentisphaerota bacterium]